MFRQREVNPHFLPRQNDPVIQFSPQPRSTQTSIEPPHGPRPQPPIHQPQSGPRPQPSLRPDFPMHQPQSGPKPQLEMPHHHRQEQTPHPTSRTHRHHDSSLLRVPTSRRTKPLAWLVAAFCVLFWIIIIIGGLIILTIYLIFRPRNPRFDVNAVTLNAVYLDMGYLLNADITVLANFTNPNTKVNVDFSYVIFELHYGKNFIATRYIEPFSILRRESRFVGVHLVSSEVRLSMADSLELQREMGSGRVNLELKGMFRARSKLGGIFQYSYWLNVRCQIAVTGPPTGVLIGKRCTTK